jgi:hypothetical protein
MRKLLGFVLPVLFVLTAFGEPIVPWPLDINHEHLSSHDVEGSWVAFDQNNTIWFVKVIRSNIKSKTSIIIARSGANIYTPQVGWLLPVDGVFAGKVTSLENHELSIMIFKNLDGLYLRLGTGKEKYQDFMLYRDDSGPY